jgi:DNA-binding transcriptional LysR family regulator
MMMNVTLRQINAFVLLARTGNFTRAAQEMHVTQSALSLLARALEAGLETRLVDRTTRNVTLTATGVEFYASAQRFLANLEQAVGNIHQLENKWGRSGLPRLMRTPLNSF